MTETKIRNPREVFEREARLFNHISAMYKESRGFEHYWQNRRKDHVLKEMEHLIRQGKAKSLLDIGCAEGLFTRKAVNFGFKLVVGLEISKIKLTRALGRAHNRGIKIDYVLGSAENLPFRNNTFDLALLSQSLNMFQKKNNA